MVSLSRAVAGAALLFVGHSIIGPRALAQQSPPPPKQPDAVAPPVLLPGLSYDVPFFPGAKYDANVPTPDMVLGFRVGDKPATHAQIEAVVKAIAAKSPRTKLFEYATSHEGRRLYYLVISSEANIKKLDQIKADLGKFADPRSVSGPEGDALAATLPAVAWMAYAIHGDEMSGSDAALAVAHHLAACTDEPVKKMLEELVVIIDPLMNPDGRDRCLAQVAQDRTRQPSVDDQAVIHSGVWPSGRMNHYLFDLNRDWIYCTQPETRGRVAAAGPWHPQLFMESHEMGSQDSFLFSPPRQPVNPNVPENVKKWWPGFAADIARDFDAFGWRYYTGEWNEEWYPGYSGAWAGFRGAIDVLYEQASITTDGVRRAEGTIETYREAVHHQLVATMANLTSLQKNRAAVMKDYLAERRAAVSVEGPGPARTFAIVRSANTARVREFVDLMELQGFEVHSAAANFTASGRDRLGKEFADREFPAGTILVAERQPERRLIAAMLEFDPRMTPEFLADERRELLRFGRSKLYDVTGWNIPMMFDLEACELAVDLPGAAQRGVPVAEGRPVAMPERAQSPVGFVIDGADDRSVAVAARLLERGVKVRCADKPFELGGTAYPRSSLVILRKDNALFVGDLATAVGAAALEWHVRAAGLDTGLGEGDNPDLGGQHFVLLEAPRIAVVGREPFHPYSYGEIWHLLDHVMGVRATFLNSAVLSGADLRRYNVLVVPQGDMGAIKDKDALKQWVRSGGTLVAIGPAAAGIATEAFGLSAARVLPDVLTKIDDYAMKIMREWEGLRAVPDPEAVWAFTAPAEVKFPWAAGKEEKPSDDEVKRRDAWKSVFSPQGAIVAGRVDDRHWLTGGCGEYLPVVYGGDTVLMAAQGVEAPVRLGVFDDAPPEEADGKAPENAEGAEGAEKSKEKRAGNGKETPRKDAPTKDPQRTKDGKDNKESPAADQPVKKTPEKTETGRQGDRADNADDDDDDDKAKEKEKEKKVRRAGWALLPEGKDLRLRMSGLLWPEAAERIANSAYVTREGVGSGQVILFAANPTFRGAAKGTARVFANAVVLGPGMGASHPIKP